MNASDLHRRLRRSALVAVAGVLLATSIAPQSSASTDGSQSERVSANEDAAPDAVVGPKHESCDEIIGWVPVSRADVDPLVPDEFEVAERAPGVANLFVRTYRCANVTLGDTTVEQEIGSQVAVSIVSPDEGATTTPTIDIPGVINADLIPECCNWYLLSWATDNEDMLRWLARGPLPIPRPMLRTQHVEGSVFDFQPLSGTKFTDPRYHFVTGPGSPIPFEMRASTADPWMGLVPDVAYWVLGPQGPVKVFASSNLCIGYGQGVVVADPGSEMAELMGAKVGPFASLFSANSFTNGFYAKGRLGAHADPFERPEEVDCS